MLSEVRGWACGGVSSLRKSLPLSGRDTRPTNKPVRPAWAVGAPGSSHTQGGSGQVPGAGVGGLCGSVRLAGEVKGVTRCFSHEGRCLQRPLPARGQYWSTPNMVASWALPATHPLHRGLLGPGVGSSARFFSCTHTPGPRCLASWSTGMASPLCPASGLGRTWSFSAASATFKGSGVPEAVCPSG